ncbi:MAG: hypothetical protein ABI321_13705, partial [Polyangia bacterium]
PAWADQTGRAHLGDVMPVKMVARSDDDEYARIWELSIRGGHSNDTLGMKPASEEHFGHVTLRSFDRPAQTVLRDLSADFPQARVTSRRVGEGADEHPCGGTGKERQCGSTTVGQRVMEIDYKPRRGVLAPVIPGQIVSIAYDDVEGGLLVGYAGLHDYYARKSASGVVSFRVRVDSTKSILMPLRNEDGWKRFELPLEPGKHLVVFEFSSEEPAWRLPGFHAELRAADGAGAP